jgi:quercetin dioxygenase-like cupin family protein
MTNQQSAEIAGQPRVVRAGKSISGSPLRFIGKEMWVKLAGGDQEGGFTVIEDVSPSKSGPPLHSHGFEEWFYILEGEFLFELNGEPVTASVGDFLHAPSNVPHVFQNIGNHQGRMLLIAKPGGVENYFAELSERMITDPTNIPALSALAASYGVTLLGPPIAARPARNNG